MEATGPGFDARWLAAWDLRRIDANAAIGDAVQLRLEAADADAEAEAEADADADDVADLLARTDHHLYRAKHLGKARVHG